MLEYVMQNSTSKPTSMDADSILYTFTVNEGRMRVLLEPEWVLDMIQLIQN
jgi:hypothetical protein